MSKDVCIPVPQELSWTGRSQWSGSGSEVASRCRFDRNVCCLLVGVRNFLL